MCPCVCVNTYVFISLVKGRVAEFTHFEKHGYSFFSMAVYNQQMEIFTYFVHAGLVRFGQMCALKLHLVFTWVVFV